MAKETKNFGKTILEAISEIFTPIIPVLIGSGLIGGLGKMLQSFGVDANLVWMKALILIGYSVYTYIIILVAMNSAKYIGGSPVLGAVAGMIMINPSLADMGLTVGRGGVFGAILAGLLIAVVEKKVREILPKALKVQLTAFVALILAGVIIIYVIQPITGWFSTALTNFILLLLNKGGAVAGAIISALFLPLVMTGLHHGLAPINLQLIEEVGYTTLTTLSSMGGAGQVGAALALLLKFRNDEKFKTTIKGALPVAILGIGEPLIYGVTLPLFTPFLTACLGAAVGGAIVGWLGGFGARAVYVSGILAIATNTNVLYYVISYGAAVLAGFVFTSFLKFPAKKVEE